MREFLAEHVVALAELKHLEHDGVPLVLERVQDCRHRGHRGRARGCGRRAGRWNEEEGAVQSAHRGRRESRRTSLDVDQVLWRDGVARDGVAVVILAEVLEHEVALVDVPRLCRHNRLERRLARDCAHRQSASCRASAASARATHWSSTATSLVVVSNKISHARHGRGQGFVTGREGGIYRLRLTESRCSQKLCERMSASKQKRAHGSNEDVRRPWPWSMRRRREP